MFQGIHIPDAVIIILQFDMICTDIKWQLFLLSRKDRSLAAFVNQLCPFVHCLDIIAQIQHIRRTVTTIKNDRLTVTQLLIQDAAHIGQIHCECGGIHG